VPHPVHVVPLRNYSVTGIIAISSLPNAGSYSNCNVTNVLIVVCWKNERWCCTVTYMDTAVIRMCSSTAVTTALPRRSAACWNESFRTCCLATRPTCSHTRTAGFTYRRTRRGLGELSSITWAFSTATLWRYEIVQAAFVQYFGRFFL